MGSTLLEKLLHVVERFPDKEAIVHGSRRTMYRELGAQAFAVACALRQRIERGDRVALLMDNSAEYAASCYGTWLADGVVVGLNTALKAADLAHLIQHSAARCLVADPSQRELGGVRALVGQTVDILEAPIEGSLPDGEWGSEVPPRAESTSLATIIYTSGTTGHPKGVMLSHGNLVANTESICRYLEIDEREKALCVLPFYYSYGASVLHTHLSSGATLLLENSFMYPHAVMEGISAEQVTSFAGVPSTFYLLLKRTDLSTFDLSSLRYVTQAGGPMDPDRIRQFREKVPAASFIVMYGQTEATARLTYLPPTELESKPGSAGRAIPGVELRVRDDGDVDLPPGQLGEVCARGENVMMGYWNDPDETAAVLKGGWLHTRDLGYLDEEGYLFLRGRSQEMIKSGAHRISPAEIEEVIRGVRGVDEVAVVGIDDEVLGQAIKACVVSTEAGDSLRRQILSTCRQELALFKVPKVVEFRSELPRTASGKVKRHLL
jgi:acyl-CoA synthetase (AMP-forming)/AMP-acid ligase II